ncbi:mitochondrial membrane protein [Kappamyces sp. JEL0680]|nr:mitochondrial membrane protein [Kappamyces sp. JEL0680]
MTLDGRPRLANPPDERLPLTLDAQEPPTADDIEQCRREFDEKPDSVQAKFNYAWILVRSNVKSNQRQGLGLLNGLALLFTVEIYKDTPTRRRECLYYLSLGEYKLGNYHQAKDYVSSLLAVEPGNTQAQTLRDRVNDKITQDGLFGMALVGVPYVSAGEWVASVIFFLVSIFGTLGLLAVIISTAAQRNNSPSTYLLLSLCVGDLLYSSSSVIFEIINLARGGWGTGAVGCHISNVIVLCACFCSVMTLFFISLERYLSVVWQIMVSMQTVSIWIVVIWLISLFISLFPLMTGIENEIVGLQTAKLICAINWVSTNPFAYAIIALCLFTLAV